MADKIKMLEIRKFRMTVPIWLIKLFMKRFISKLLVRDLLAIWGFAEW